MSNNNVVFEIRRCNPAILPDAYTQPISHDPQPVQPDTLLQAKSLYTPAEAAKILGIGTNNIYNLLRSRQLKSIRIGRLIKVPRTALEEFLQQD